MAEQGLEGCGQPLLVGGGGPAAVTGEISVDAGAGQDEDHVNRALVGHGGRGRQADQVAAVGERKSSWWPLASRDQAAATPPKTVRSEDEPPD